MVFTAGNAQATVRWSAPEFTGGTVTTAYEVAHLIRSGKFDVVLTAFNYSLLWREAEIEVLPAAREQGMGVILGSPLQQGALAECFREQVDDPGVCWLSPSRRAQLVKLYELVDQTCLCPRWPCASSSPTTTSIPCSWAPAPMPKLNRT